MVLRRRPQTDSTPRIFDFTKSKAKLAQASKILFFCCTLVVLMVMLFANAKLLFGKAATSDLHGIHDYRNQHCEWSMYQLVTNMPTDQYISKRDSNLTVDYRILKKPVNIFSFPECSKSLLPKVKERPKINPECFRPVMNVTERAKTVVAFKKVVDIFRSRGLFVIMGDGNLLGSLRYFGQLSWEGDLDLAVLKSDRLKVRSLVTEIHKNYTEFWFRDTEKLNNHLTMYILCPENSRKLNSWAGCGRSKIDIFFYWKTAKQTFYRGYWAHLPLKAIFPTTWRPYDGHLFPAPKDSVASIKAEYGENAIETCVDFIKCGKFSVKCDALATEYGHVKKIIYNSTYSMELYIDKHLRIKEIFLSFIRSS